MSPNLTTLLDLCNTSSRGIWTNNVFRKDGETQPLAEAGHQTPNTASRRGETPSNRARDEVGSKTSRDMDSKHETLKPFHGFASSWSLLNQGTKRCCVCRDFTAARCDHRATKCVWLDKVSKTARVTLKATKHEVPRKPLKDTCRDQQGRGDTLQWALQTWSWEQQKTWFRIQSGPDKTTRVQN